MRNKYQMNLASVLAWLYLVVLALLPFHAFLTTWAGGSWGHLDVWRIWKEVIIFASVPGVLWLVWKKSDLRSRVFSGWLAWLVIGYTVLGLLMGLFAVLAHKANAATAVYGLFTDLRFPAFMMLALVVAGSSPIMRRWWKVALIVPLGLVIAFGLLQLILPTDFLTHFGYGPKTIPAAQFVDNKPEYMRLQSTLRGANPLGAYLVFGVTALVACIPRGRRYWPFVPAGLVVLGYTYSRSAYIGLAASLAVFAWLAAPGRRVRRYAPVALAVAATCGICTIVALRNNDTVQNVVFHSDEHSQSEESSNTGRARNLQNGLGDVASNPLGEGVGTAGPASTRNTVMSPRIAENFYLQIGQEMGWLGLALLVAVQVQVFRRLWVVRRMMLPRILLASGVGLTIVNLLSHAWADDTLGLLWWGVAGIAISMTIRDNTGDTDTI